MCTDVSVQPSFDPLRWDGHAVPKRRYTPTIPRCVKFQNRADLTLTINYFKAVFMKIPKTVTPAVDTTLWKFIFKYLQLGTHPMLLAGVQFKYQISRTENLLPSRNSRKRSHKRVRMLNTSTTLHTQMICTRELSYRHVLDDLCTKLPCFPFHGCIVLTVYETILYQLPSFVIRALCGCQLTCPWQCASTAWQWPRGASVSVMGMAHIWPWLRVCG
jgi:hypothetical protein